MDELLDKDAKSELESELCINWSEEVKPPYKLKMFADPRCLSRNRIYSIPDLLSGIQQQKRREEKICCLSFFVAINFTFESIDTFKYFKPKNCYKALGKYRMSWILD
jgi:hypothetical protein